MIECKVCLMNSSINEFYTNNDGICNFCTDWDLKKSSYRDFSEKQEKQNLHNLKNEIIKSNPKGKYDCIIGLSGGTDSSYVTYLAWKMGLNALVIHMDNGWNSKISNLNIDRLLDKTGFDYKTLILNWNEFKDLQKSFLKAGVPDIELITDHAIFAYILNYALENNIKYILSGVNYATEHSVIPSWGWRKDDFNHIKKIHKLFGEIKLKTFPKMYPFKKFFYEKIIRKVKTINILDRINYSSNKAKDILQKEVSWENYGGKHEESFFTMFFQGYILPKKFNIDKRILHLSCLIRNGEISKKMAQDLISMPTIDTQRVNEYVAYFKKKLSLNDEEFNKIMDTKPKNHSDYSIDIYNNFFVKQLMSLIKKAI